MKEAGESAALAVTASARGTAFARHHIGCPESKLLYPHFPCLPHHSFYSAVKRVPFLRGMGTISLVCCGQFWGWDGKIPFLPLALLWVCTLWLKGAFCLVLQCSLSPGFSSWLFVTLGPFFSHCLLFQAALLLQSRGKAFYNSDRKH